MTIRAKLAWVRFVHSAIFVVMAAAVIYIFICGALGRTDPLLVASLVLVLVESAIFLGNGRQCPLTNLAKSYGATKGYVFDTWFPERLTRYTLPFFGSLLGLGVLLWLFRFLV